MCAVSLLCGVYLLGAAYVPLPAQSALPVLPRLERSSTRSKARLATATTPAADAEPISPVINEEADGEATLVGTVAAVAEEDEATLASELVGTVAAVVDVAAPLPQSALMPDDEPAPRRFLDEEAAKAAWLARLDTPTWGPPKQPEVPLFETVPGPVDVQTLETGSLEVTLPPGIEVPMPTEAISTFPLEVPEAEAEEKEETVPIFEVTLPDLPETAKEDEAEAAAPKVVDLSPLPGLGELAAFCLPTLGIWLSSPLLSLIDTSVVGISCVEAQLAALAPSTKLCDYAAFFCTVIAAATTNLAADKFARNEPTQAKRVVGGALMVSVWLGMAITLFFGLFARPLMRSMLGANPAADVLSAATDYTAIRALGYPAALLTMTLQAAFIATKDATTPLLAVPVTALVNLVGDLILVRPLGAAGTAWATVASLYVNAVTLMAFWARKVRDTEGENIVLTWPTKPEASALFSFAAPMMVALIARVYMGLSVTLSAVACGTTALAANQVVESLYWLFCPFGDAVSLCMQAYLPPLLLEGRALAQRLQTLALRAAGGLGVLAGLGATALPLLAPTLFTSSQAIASLMGTTALPLGVALLAYVLSCTAEGMLTARKQLRFLAVSHVANTVGLVAALAWMRRLPRCGLPQIWTAIAAVNLLRYIEFRWALVREERKAMRAKWQESLTAAARPRGLRWHFYRGAKTTQRQTDDDEQGSAEASAAAAAAAERVNELVPDIASAFPDLLFDESEPRPATES